MGLGALERTLKAAVAAIGRVKLVQGYLLHYGGTIKHKGWVAYYLARYVLSTSMPHERWKLARRALVHDLSKVRYDEARGFATTIRKLRHSTYGSDEYKDLLDRIRPSIQLHYARNRHHPEWHTMNASPGYEPGYRSMGWLDKVEMVADWAAAVRRHADGDLMRSIEKNAERFGYDEREVQRLSGIASRMGAL